MHFFRYSFAVRLIIHKVIIREYETLKNLSQPLFIIFLQKLNSVPSEDIKSAFFNFLHCEIRARALARSHKHTQTHINNNNNINNVLERKQRQRNDIATKCSHHLIFEMFVACLFDCICDDLKSIKSAEIKFYFIFWIQQNP